MLESHCYFIKSIVDDLSKFNIVGDVAIFIGCQFALESNFGSSDLAIMSRNFSGMKLPKVRRSTAINFGSSDKWCKYLCKFDCVTDYVLCLQYRQPLSKDFESVNRFVSFIKGWYCPEKTYIDRIYKIYVQFKNLQDGK